MARALQDACHPLESVSRHSAVPYLSHRGEVREIRLRCTSSHLQQQLALYASNHLRRQLRCNRLGLASKTKLPELTIAVPHWQHEHANLTGFDRLFEKVAGDGDFSLVLWTRDWLDGAQPALELLNRYQRLLPLPLGYRPLPRLGELLNTRRLLTSSREGNDAWRWLLRLTARPPCALELAALFHDVLLPADETDARATWSALACLGFRRAELAEATALATQSRLGEGSTPELALLRDALDLCFFSNQSLQFSRAHGPATTRAHVRLLLGRMTSRAVCMALATRQPADVSAMMENALDQVDRTPDSGVRRT